MECVGCVCVYSSGGVGEKGEWIRGLDLGFTNPMGTGGVLGVCLCFGCGGVGDVGGELVEVFEGLEGWCGVCPCEL